MEEKKKLAEQARKNKEAKKNAGKEDTEEKVEKEEKDEDMGADEKDKETPEAKMEVEAVVELTDEEKQLWYRKLALPDLSQKSLARSYASFTLPTAEEGFDEVRFVWQPKEKCESHLREWLLNQERTQRAEDLEPSAWFNEEFGKWKKLIQDWKKQQSIFKDPVK